VRRFPRWVIGGSSVLALALSVGIVAMILSRTHRGEPFDQYVLQGDKMKLRVTAYAEKGILLPVPGAFYTYECQIGSGEPWREIATFRHDDQIAIPRKQIRVINAEVTYFYIGWIYGVTRDAGRTWTVWNAEKDLQGWHPADYRFITDVELQPDGTGTMHVNKLRFPHNRLVTIDFGRTWRIKP
jgi:hypothetical protein